MTAYDIAVIPFITFWAIVTLATGYCATSFITKHYRANKTAKQLIKLSRQECETSAYARKDDTA